MNNDPDPGPGGQWPPPYERRPVGIIATMIVLIAGIMGLTVVAVFIFFAIAVANFDGTN